MIYELYAYKTDLEWWEQNGIDHWNTSGAGTPCVDTEDGMREWIDNVQAVMDAAELIVTDFRCLALHQYDPDTEAYRKIHEALALLGGES